MCVHVCLFILKLDSSNYLKLSVIDLVRHQLSPDRLTKIACPDPGHTSSASGRQKLCACLIMRPEVKKIVQTAP